VFKYSFGFQKNKALKPFCLTKTHQLHLYFCLMKKQYGFLLSLLFFSFISCNNSNSTDGGPETNTSSIPVSTPSIVSTLPHDTSYFIEGLEFYNNSLLESTGNYGPSKLLELDPKTGKVLKEVKLGEKYFGEGITVLHDTLYQLTYKENTVFAYDAKTFKKIKELPFKGEGWGMTNDGKNIIVSNGSSNLYYYEPGTFNLLKTVAVTENDAAVPNINELEYVDGYVYANQWQYDYIVKIDPLNGNVVAKYDLGGLHDSVKRINPNSEVLNGIAYNPVTKKFYVTGKNWPQMFEIQF
jgi:glutamine cyclotransferase